MRTLGQGLVEKIESGNGSSSNHRYGKSMTLPLKIVLISAFFPPEVGSAAHLYYELGQALKDRGHEVTVLTGLPRYHVLGVKKSYRRRPFISETYCGLNVLRVLNIDIPWNNPVLRGLDQFVSAFFTGMAGICLPVFDAVLVYLSSTAPGSCCPGGVPGPASPPDSKYSRPLSPKRHRLRGNE